MSYDHGVGKSLFALLVREIYGHKYARKVTNKVLKDSYNGWAQMTFFCDAEEVQLDRSTYNTLKDMITDSSIPIRIMRVDPFNVQSYMNVFMASNEDAPVLLQEKDRRVIVIDTPAGKLPEDVKADMLTVLHDTEELSNLLSILIAHKSSFNPYGHAIETEGKLELIQNSRPNSGQFVDWLCDIMTDDAKIKREVLTTLEIKAIYKTFSGGESISNSTHRVWRDLSRKAKAGEIVKYEYTVRSKQLVDGTQKVVKRQCYAFRNVKEWSTCTDNRLWDDGLVPVVSAILVGTASVGGY
jgi:phage/plasmid-associated DNA primase